MKNPITSDESLHFVSLSAATVSTGTLAKASSGFTFPQFRFEQISENEGSVFHRKNKVAAVFRDRDAAERFACKLACV